MTKVRTITHGIDTPGDYGAPTVLIALAVPAIADQAGIQMETRVLFMPSFHPEVWVGVMVAGAQSKVSLITLQTNLWHRRGYEMQCANGTPHAEPAARASR